jgi:ferredoxin
MDARSKVCHSCAVAVQKSTFTIPPKRETVIRPYFEERRRMKRFRSM